MSQRLYIDLHDGQGFRDYTAFWYDVGSFVSDKKNEPRLWDFRLVPVPGQTDPAWVQPGRGAYVKYVDTRFISRDSGVAAGILYTGYITDSPDIVSLGSRNGTEFVGLEFKCTSDEYLLNLRPCPVRTYVNKTRGEILRDLAQAAYAPSVLPLDVTGIQNGGTENLYQTDAVKSWTDVAREFAEADGYAVFAMSGRVFYRPTTSPWTAGNTARELSVSTSDPRYSPDNRSLSKVSNAIVNDVTVVGEDEPRGRVEERWISDGYSGDYRLRYVPFGVNEFILLNDDLTETLDAGVWQEVDAVQDYIQVFDGALNVTGGTGAYGGAYLMSRKGVEIAGVIETRDGEVYFPPTPSGEALLGAFCNGTVPNTSTIWCGWKIDMTPVSTPGGTLDGYLQAYGPSGVISTGIYLNKTHHYILRKQISAPPLPAITPRTSSDGTVFTKAADDSGNISITWTVEDIDPTDPGNVKKSTSVVAQLTVSAESQPRFLLYSPISSKNVHLVMNTVQVRKPPQITVALDGTRLLQVGSFLDGGRCAIVEENDSAKLAWYSVSGAKALGSYYDGVLNENPSYYWRLNGADATTLDEGYNSAHATKAGTVTTAPSLIEGEPGNSAVTFAGAGRYTTQAAVSINMAFSIECLLSTSSSATKNPVVDGRVSTTDGVMLFLRSGKPALRIELGSPTEIVANTAINDGLKHHIMVTHDAVAINDAGATTNIYIDGVLDKSATQQFRTGLSVETQILEFARSRIAIDGGDAANVYGAFTLDELAIYPYALTPDQVTDHANRRRQAIADVATIPPQGTEVSVAYHRRDKSRARLQSPGSISTESALFGDDGVRRKLLTTSDVTPAPRTSEECLQVARAYLDDNQSEQWAGSYTFETTSSGASRLEVYPRPGDPVRVMFSAGSLSVDQTLEVTNVTSEIVGVDAYAFTLEFGPVNRFDRIQRDLLLKRRSSLTDAAIETITVFEDDTVETSYPPPDPTVDVTAIGDTTCSISMGASLPTGVTGYEVRRTDSGWGEQGYISRSTLLSRTLDRGEHDKIWYVKAYDGSTPAIYSERSAAVRVDYPLANAIALVGLTGDINSQRVRLVIPYPTERYFAGVQIRETNGSGKILYEGDGVNVRRRSPGLDMILENGSFFMEMPNPSSATSKTFWVASYNLRNSMGPASTVMIDTPAPTVPESTNTGGSVVSRDASGNFSAGTITAALDGNAASATTASNLSVSDDASSDVTVYPTWVSGTGSRSVKVSSSKLSFNPLTGVLTAAGFSGQAANGITMTPQASGFTIAGGTASKTLTVPADASVSGTNTGDQPVFFSAHLGGSRSEIVTSSLWTPVIHYQTFRCLATYSYTFRTEAKTEDAGTPVYVRLYDVTAGSAVAGGTSAASSALAWTESMLTVSLVEGHRYRAEVRGSNENAAVLVGQATIETQIDPASAPSTFLGSGPYHLVTMGDSKTLAGNQSGGFALQLDTALEAATSASWATSYYAVGSSTLIGQVDTSLSSIIAQVPDTSGLEVVCVINWGVNEMYSLPTEAAWVAHYQQLIDAIVAKAPLAKCILTKPWYVSHDAEAATEAGWVDTIIASRPGVAFEGPDEAVWLKGSDNGATMTSDGVHYSTAGHAECCAQLLAIITA